jgi:adenylyltransferase/sulfurtransferase
MNAQHRKVVKMNPKDVSLDPSELERYDRQMRIPGWGVEGQKKLKAARVTVAGAGGLGCPVSLYLAAAGVGHITIIDKETVELSNLNRQVLHWQADIGKYKADSVVAKLRSLNSSIEVEAVKAEITEKSVRGLIKDADIVVDGMDNFTTRFILNYGCVKEDIPFVHAGVYGLDGQMTTIIPKKGPCLQCIFPEKPPEFEKFPVAGVTPATLAILQALETIKLIIGLGKPLVGRMLLFDGDALTFSTMEVRRDPNCPVCGKP